MTILQDTTALEDVDTTRPPRRYHDVLHRGAISTREWRLSPHHHGNSKDNLPDLKQFQIGLGVNQKHYVDFVGRVPTSISPALELCVEGETVEPVQVRFVCPDTESVGVLIRGDVVLILKWRAVLDDIVPPTPLPTGRKRSLRGKDGAFASNLP